MSRDRSERFEDHKDEKLDISDFLKNINEMPNDLSYSSNLNKKHSEKEQINLRNNMSPRDKDHTFGYPNRQNNQPEIYSTEYGYDFSRKNAS